MVKLNLDGQGTHRGIAFAVYPEHAPKRMGSIRAKIDSWSFTIQENASKGVRRLTVRGFATRKSALASVLNAIDHRLDS